MHDRVKCIIFHSNKKEGTFSMTQNDLTSIGQYDKPHCILPC